jgi:hypothetical protein
MSASVDVREGRLWQRVVSNADSISVPVVWSSVVSRVEKHGR